MKELNSIRINGVNYNVGADATVDQQYNPSSANAQSGVAVAAAVDGKADIADVNTALAGKQNVLTFDSTPTSGSNNPVTSGGTAAALS